MKKIIVSPMVALMLLSGNCFAQENKTSDSSSVKRAKNMFGLNLATALITLMGGSNEFPRLGISYKRAFKEGYLRAGFCYTERRGTIFAQPYYSVQLNDSTRRDFYNYYEADEQYQLNLGFEHVFGKRKLEQFIGADLIGGFSHSHNYHFAQDIRTDTILPPSPYAGSYEEVIATQDLGTVFFTKLFVGVSPFYGIRYPLTKHFSISAQVGYDFSIGFETGTRTINSGSQGEFHSTYFDINTPGLINDVSLVYRF